MRSLLSFTSKQSTGRCGRRRPQTVVVTIKRGKDKTDLVVERAEAANRGSSGRNNTASVFFSERSAGWPRRWHAVSSLEISVLWLRCVLNLMREHSGTFHKRDVCAA